MGVAVRSHCFGGLRRCWQDYGRGRAGFRLWLRASALRSNSRRHGPGWPVRTVLGRPGKLVLDRSFVSELVYGPLQHGRSRISIAEAASLASIIAEREGVLVHLTGHPEEIAARLRARDGHSPPLRKIRELLDAYVNAFVALAGAAPIITTEPSKWTSLES